VQRIRTKAPEQKSIQMPQYLPIQPIQPQKQQQSQVPQQQHPQQQQTNANIFPSYGQFPSTYPYNTLNPAQFFDQSFQQNIQPTTVNPATINPSAGMYAPIPFVNQSIQPGIQQDPASIPSNGGGGGQQFQPQVMMATAGQVPAAGQQPPRQGNFVVEITRPPSRGIYVDDTRNVKRPKIEPKRIYPFFRLLPHNYKSLIAASAQTAVPKPVAPKVHPISSPARASLFVISTRI